MEETKKKILDSLKRGETSTTEISFNIREGYWKVVLALKQLEDDGLVERDNKKSWTFWKLKEGGNENDEE